MSNAIRTKDHIRLYRNQYRALRLECGCCRKKTLRLHQDRIRHSKGQGDGVVETLYRDCLCSVLPKCASCLRCVNDCKCA